MKKKLKGASVASIEIERGASSLTVNIQTAKPGIVIGRGGAQVEELKKTIKQQFLKPGDSLQLNIQEVANPMLSAEIVAENMALELEKRMPFRRVMKQAIGRVERAGVRGVKVTVAGRLNGAEIARTETLSSGSLPLHTIRADIDYAQASAHTTYGVIGIKVWIYKGQIFSDESRKK